MKSNVSNVIKISLMLGLKTLTLARVIIRCVEACGGIVGSDVCVVVCGRLEAGVDEMVVSIGTVEEIS